MTDQVSSVSGNNNKFSYMPNPYFLDYDDIDPVYGDYSLLNGPMSMNRSIFGTSNPMMEPMMPMMGPMGMYGNNQDYFRYMRDYQKMNIDYNVEGTKLQRNADLKTNASMEAINNSFALLKDKIINNEQGQVIEAYNKFVNAVAAAYGDGSEAEIKARAKTIFKDLNGGKSLIEDLRENGNSSFVQGAINAITFGTYATSSVEDNISEITNSPVLTTEKAMQNTGRVAGATGLGLFAGLIAKALKLGKLGKIIGIGAMALSGITSFATGKVST